MTTVIDKASLTASVATSLADLWNKTTLGGFFNANQVHGNKSANDHS